MLTEVVLPDGGRVLAGPVRDLDAAACDHAVALLARAPARTATPVRLVRWPDLLLPLRSADAVAALVEAHRRAATDRVAVVCGHGRGRTGAALAVLAALAGLPADGVVPWVRRRYREDAIETPWQRRWSVRTARTATSRTASSPGRAA